MLRWDLRVGPTMIQLGPYAISCYGNGMQFQINIAEAKSKLSELVARAEAGETIVLARAGKPAVTLQPVAASRKALRKPGALKHLGPLPDPDVFLESDGDFVQTDDDFLS